MVISTIGRNPSPAGRFERGHPRIAAAELGRRSGPGRGELRGGLLRPRGHIRLEGGLRALVLPRPFGRGHAPEYEVIVADGGFGPRGILHRLERRLREG